MNKNPEFILQVANKPENRRIRPWVIAMAHRPMYCSNSNDAMHCNNIDNTVRTGFPYSQNGSTKYILGLEDLFYNEGVDIIIAAHEHSYERFWPVYNLTVSLLFAEGLTEQATATLMGSSFIKEQKRINRARVISHLIPHLKSLYLSIYLSDLNAIIVSYIYASIAKPN